MLERILVDRLYWGTAVKRSLVLNLILFACTGLLVAQEFEINGGQTSPQKQSGKNSASKTSSTQSGSIGWGSSIEVGRFSRAAQDALSKGNYSAAADYAQRGVKAAPQDARLWFLLGYASRLAGRAQQSLDAYQHGLQLAPNSV